MDVFLGFCPLARARALLFAALCLCCCSPGGPAATVPGKTVYRGMAVEGAEIRALRRNGGAWAEAASVKSGYHGSFCLRLPPGSYLLRAQSVLPSDRGTVFLDGEARDIAVTSATGRLGRVVIVLQPAGGGGQDGPPQGARPPP